MEKIALKLGRLEGEAFLGWHICNQFRPSVQSLCGLLEIVDLDVVLSEQFIKIGSRFSRKVRGLGRLSTAKPQQMTQIFFFEFVPDGFVGFDWRFHGTVHRGVQIFCGCVC